jgi:hypothetical protein
LRGRRPVDARAGKEIVEGNPLDGGAVLRVGGIGVIDHRAVWSLRDDADVAVPAARGGFKEEGGRIDEHLGDRDDLSGLEGRQRLDRRGPAGRGGRQQSQGPK